MFEKRSIAPDSWDRAIGWGCSILLAAGVLFDVFVR